MTVTLKNSLAACSAGRTGQVSGVGEVPLTTAKVADDFRADNYFAKNTLKIPPFGLFYHDTKALACCQFPDTHPEDSLGENSEKNPMILQYFDVKWAVLQCATITTHGTISAGRVPQ